MRLLTLLMLASCAPKIPPDQAWLAGERESALEQQERLAAEEGDEQALNNLRLASMALAEGDQDLAERALRFAVGRMQDFRADGELQALLVREESKEWKGEPYEKLAAFFTLGVLLHAEGDRGNALAMYKSAIIADAGTAEERYRSDFVAAYVMQALAYQAEGEPGNAETAMGRAVDALYARTLTELLSGLLADVEVRGPDGLALDYEAASLAKLMLLSGIPAGVMAFPRDPAEAARAAVSQASDIAAVQRGLPRRERRPEFKGISDRDFEAATGAMAAIAAEWRAAAETVPDAQLRTPRQWGEQLEGLLDAEPSVILVVESGRGPRKVREGEYGQILKIVPSRSPHRPPSVTIESSEGEVLRPRPVYLDSYTWQGTTRGSRKVDGFLQGKAIYKDASFFGGMVLDSIADVARASNSDELAAVMEIASLALLVSGAITTPAADIREWGLLADGLYLVTAELDPGEYGLNIGGRTYVLEVPETGQLVGLVPALPPGGAARIAPR